MKGIGKIVEKRSGELVFALLSGVAYFIMIASFVIAHTENGGMMLSLYFAPAIICGAALILIKAIRKLKDEEQTGKINMLIYPHILLFLISLVFLADIIISR